MQGAIGEFPGCLAELMKVKSSDEEKRDAIVVKRLMRRLLQALASIHVRVPCHAAPCCCLLHGTQLRVGLKS